MNNGQVVIRQGNMFDGAKDLIVIPCNTKGGVTRVVLETLLKYDLEFSAREMNLGDVHFQKLTTVTHVAQFLAYAASVEQNTSISTPEALYEIGKSLGSFANDTPTVRLISAPLLGTGYGGLPPQISVEALKIGFLETSPPNSTLCLNIFDPTAYDIVLRAHKPKFIDAIKVRRVFISYTQSSQENANWVRALGTMLRNNGIEARLDVWHLRPGMDLPQWMCTELSLADKVIIVSDEAYTERADGRLGGVGWETMVIQGELSKLRPDSTKYLVVVRSPDFEKGVPIYLKTKFAIHSPPGNDMEKLIHRLVKEINDFTDIPEVTLPKLRII